MFILPARKDNMNLLEHLDAIAQAIQPQGVTLYEAEKQFRKLMIEAGLRRTNGNQIKATKELGYNHRNTLARDIQRLGIDVAQFKTAKKPAGKVVAAHWMERAGA